MVPDGRIACGPKWLDCLWSLVAGLPVVPGGRIACGPCVSQRIAWAEACKSQFQTIVGRPGKNLLHGSN